MANKTRTGLLAAAAMLLSAPAFADSVLHIWTCKVNDGKTRQELMDVTGKWLDAATRVEGGKDIVLTLEFPIAANVGDGTFNFVLSIPDPEAWGVWENNYPGSMAEGVDDEWSEVATCQNSSLWASVRIE